MSGPNYAQFAKRTPEPSTILSLLPEVEGVPDVYAVQSRLTELPLKGSRIVETPRNPDAEWELETTFTFNRDEPPWKAIVSAERSDFPIEAHTEWMEISSEERAEAGKSSWSIGVRTEFGDRPLVDLHRQARILATVAPNPVAVMDLAACTAHPARWLKEIAESSVPPSPENLFVIHCVYDDETPDRSLWLHTHGLHRCGSIELEMMDVPREDQGLLGQLVNSTAAIFIEQGTPPPDNPFEAGYRLGMVWLPWEEGILKQRPTALGAMKDRDESHSVPSGMLFVRSRGFLGFGRKYRSPANLVPILSDNPILYVSKMETERRALLARERLDQFTRLYREYGGKEEWKFLIKLGYTVDGAGSESEREHLWFLVEGIEGRTVDAVLTNQPYHIARMNRDDRGKHSVDLMTDWTVLNSAMGQFTPDNIGELKERLSG